MCLYNGFQQCNLYGEKEGSKKGSLRYSHDQMMCLDTSPPLTTLRDLSVRQESNRFYRLYKMGQGISYICAVLNATTYALYAMF